MSNTAVYNVRLDLRSIAVLHRHYTKLGIVIPSISSLNRRAIEFMADQLVSQLGAQSFLTVAEAVDYLDANGLMKPLRNRGQNALIKGMQSESISMDGLDSSLLKERPSKISPEAVEKARQALCGLDEVDPDERPGAILGPKIGTLKEDS